MLLLLACVGFAQDAASDDEYAALRSGQLVVWVLHGGPPVNRATFVPAYRSPKPGYTTATTGELGQTSSTFGQTAGSYGVSSDSPTISVPPSGTGYAEQTSGDYGQTSGSFGHTASEHGQTASTLGQTAGSVGTNAGDAGQSAGDFGHSLSTVATAGTTDAQAMANASKRRTTQAADPFRDQLQFDIARFHGLQVRFLSVLATQLTERLAEAQGTPDFPDVVVGNPLPAEWTKVAKERGVVPLGAAMYLPQELAVGQTVAMQQRASVEAAVVLGAPHPKAARAYVLWLTEHGGPAASSPSQLPDKLRAPAVTAMAAVAGLLAGNSVGEADPAIAEFSAMLARQTALNAAVDGSPAGGSLDTRIGVLRAAANERFAVVALRVVAGSDSAFGVVHPLVVLRRANDGRWLVLQLSVNLDPAQQGRAFDRLAPLASYGAAATLCEVSLDAPSDGDTRPLTPELGWENGGGATVVVVEWQYGQGGAWADSHLYFVTDGTVRSQTRATAQFAAWPGSYRWRVWLVGKGGALKLSAWRKVNVVK